MRVNVEKGNRQKVWMDSPPLYVFKISLCAHCNQGKSVSTVRSLEPGSQEHPHSRCAYLGFYLQWQLIRTTHFFTWCLRAESQVYVSSINRNFTESTIGHTAMVTVKCMGWNVSFLASLWRFGGQMPQWPLLCSP
jgi:hypothetical protein